MLLSITRGRCLQRWKLCCTIIWISADSSSFIIISSATWVFHHSFFALITFFCVRDYGRIKFSTSNGAVRLGKHMCDAAEKKRESERNLARCQTVKASMFRISVWGKAGVVEVCTDSFSFMIFCHIHKRASIPGLCVH